MRVLTEEVVVSVELQTEGDKVFEKGGRGEGRYRHLPHFPYAKSQVDLNQ